jgi:hypothetical protein
VARSSLISHHLLYESREGNLDGKLLDIDSEIAQPQVLIEEVGDYFDKMPRREDFMR